MWEASVWGFISLGVAFGLARIAMIGTTGHAWIGVCLTLASISCFLVSMLVFVWPRLCPKPLKTQPKLILTFDPNDINGCVLFAPSGNPSIKNFRLKVELNAGEKAVQCRGFLISISGTRGLNAEPMTLTFTPAEDNESTNKTIDGGIPAFLDIITISNENLIRPHTKDFAYPGHFDPVSFFSNIGFYIFEITIRYGESSSQTCKLKLNWLGDWKTAEMEMIS